VRCRIEADLAAFFLLNFAFIAYINGENVVYIQFLVFCREYGCNIALDQEWII
jgi:hypothetical protein